MPLTVHDECRGGEAEGRTVEAVSDIASAAGSNDHETKPFGSNVVQSQEREIIDRSNVSFCRRMQWDAVVLDSHSSLSARFPGSLVPTLNQ